jgi:hypothetical protein
MREDSVNTEAVVTRGGRMKEDFVNTEAVVTGGGGMKEDSANTESVVTSGGENEGRFCKYRGRSHRRGWGGECGEDSVTGAAVTGEQDSTTYSSRDKDGWTDSVNLLTLSL